MAGDKRNKGKQKVDPQKKKKTKDLYEPGQYIQRSLYIGDDEDRAARSASATVSSRRGLVDERASRASSDDDGLTPMGTGASGGDDSVTPTTTRRRGDARSHSPSSSTRRTPIYFEGDTLLGDNGLPSFFRPCIRNFLDGFYPHWRDVPIEKNNIIWELFLKEWSLGDHDPDPDLVYQRFMSQNVDKYRKFLFEVKRTHLKTYNVDDVEGLYDKPKPPFIRSDDIWKQYLDHWNSPDQRAKGKINSQNRKSAMGMSHGYGRKGVASRMKEMRDQGKTSSMIKIMSDVNQVQDERRNPTDQVHNRDLQAALDQYRGIHEQANPGVDLEEAELDLNLWKLTDPVSLRLPKGRMLGMGLCKQAAGIFAPTKNVGGSVNAQIEELRRQQEEAQKQ